MELKLFNEYKHSKAIIYSHLEKQYDYGIIEINDKTGILTTQFDYHYVFGEVPKDETRFMNSILSFVKEQNKEEFILFCPNQEWDDFLKKVFLRMEMFYEKRAIFLLDIEKYNKIRKNHLFQKHALIDFEKDYGSNILYPYAFISNKGYCKGFMVGNRNVELDVYTEEQYRKQGIALECSLTLIEYLIANDLTPNWSCWLEKTESIHLAKKCGFELIDTINAYIWIKKRTVSSSK